MAETLASAVLGPIFQKLTDDALKKFARSQNIDSELDELESKLTHIKAVLNDASSKEINEESVRLWLNDLQHLAYDIDDILDDVATEAMHRELTPESGEFTSKVRNLVPTCCTKLSLCIRLHHKLDRITRSLQLLEKQIPVLGLVKDEKQKSNNRRYETCSPEAGVVGREGEKENLINKLLGGESSKENYSILPIVGMGGVGKTTLARLLYNDTRVQGHFELQAWVCVSDFDIFKISDAIFGCVTTENKEFKDLNKLQMALTKEVQDKRLLLVVDDVWTENYNDWENLVRPFRSCAPGSKIIMTTRKDELLKTLGFDHLDCVESLSDRDALSLLALHAFDVDNFDSHPTLRSKGEGIVGKCGGLPLALKAIGRLLRTKTDAEDWDDVLNSKIWDLKNCGDILPALRLSYHNLSSHLKQLFAYCSLFPKDFLFDKDDLVLLWMAEGYLLNQSLTNIKAPEDLGREYFEILLSRSFFQHAPNDKSFYVMHDLMNDLATCVAGDMFLRFEQQMETEKLQVEKALAKYRHMSFIRETYVGYQKFEAFEKAARLRTLLAVPFGEEQIWDQFYLSNKFLVNLIPQLPLLRVLSLRRFGIREVPDLIGNLKHLRYLNLSQTKIEELPENIGSLYNLQTLILFGCESLTKLPKSFVKLKKLKHFDIRYTPSLKKLPVGIGELRSLRTWTKIIIGDDEDGFAITELKGLSNLHGVISIEGLHNVQSAAHAREANLSLKRLTKLGLKWGNGSGNGILEKEVFYELKPHVDMLNELKIEFYEGIDFPVWVGDPCFQKLVSVSIRGCRKCKFLPSLGQLPALKKLFIEGMDEVKVIGLEFTGTSNVAAFSSLEILSFEKMSGWEEWSTNSKVLEAVFPCLGELSIKNCPKLRQVSLSALPSLRSLDIEGCGSGVLRSLVCATSSITKLKISRISELTDEAWRGALTNLGAVEEVKIWHCNDIRYLWESEAHASMVLVNIKKLCVLECENLLSLGEKEDGEDSNLLLSSLRDLEVSWCKSMEHCILNSNSIERLRIYYGESLTRVSFIGQKLKSLSIDRCKKLIMEKMINTSMPMLEYVLIRDWTDLKSQLIQLFSNSIHLTSMSIHHCPSIESFPDIQFTNLTSLRIRGCQNLKSFSNIQLPNLISLSIEGCKSLKSFPGLQLMNLTLLTDLEIVDCQSIDVASYPGGNWPPNLVSLIIGGLKKPISEWGSLNFPTSLVNLTLRNEPLIENFSQLSHLLPSSLKHLSIRGFDKLESLSVGLQHLTSLRHLLIGNCPKLKDLPEALLPSLFKLTIYGCPILTRRYYKRGSRYWPLISHIPSI
ncbi:hypothetical protein R6Q59_015023 [Mikania micrantha]